MTRGTDLPARRDAGFTLIELMLVVTMIGIVSGMAVPQLVRARGAAWEASTIGSLRIVHTAQTAYASSCGGGNYAPSIPWLARAPLGGGPPFVGPEFVADTTNRQGYSIRFSRDALVARAPESCNGLARGRTARGYFVGADLLSVTNGATRYFGVNAGGIIYQSRRRVAVTYTGAPASPARPL